MNLLDPTPKGLYCPAADLYIDPVRKVERAVITHGHADHARRGHRSALVSASGEAIVRARVGPNTRLQPLPYGERLRVGDATISLHPAGHLLGSAQVRIEVGGRIAVVTGDYKRGTDPTCEAFEPVPCHLLVTETTFGLPVYRWPNPEKVAEEIDRWWARNQAEGVNSVLLGYSLGKAQRLLAMLRPERGPILVHGAVVAFLSLYRQAGIRLPDTLTLNTGNLAQSRGQAMTVIPPAAMKPNLRRRLGNCRIGLASGWTLMPKRRKSATYDAGFAVSDHVDWPELLRTVEDTGCEELWATHGYTDEVCRYFSEKGLRTRSV